MTDNSVLIPLAITALGSIVAWIVRRFLRDMKGLSQKQNRMIEVLNLWADTDEKRKQAAALIVGKSR